MLGKGNDMISNSIFWNVFFVMISVSAFNAYGSEAISEETELGRYIATAAANSKLSKESKGKINAFLKAGKEMKRVFEQYEVQVSEAGRCKNAMQSYREEELKTPLNTLIRIATSDDSDDVERLQRSYWEEWNFTHPEIYSPDFKSEFVKLQAQIMQNIGYVNAKTQFIRAFKEMDGEPVRVMTLINGVRTAKNIQTYRQLLEKL